MVFKKRWFNILLTILIIIEIWLVSSISQTNLQTQNIEIAPTAYHFIIFFLLSVFLFSSISHNKKISLKNFLTTIILSLAYSLSDEIHQLFVPNRYFSMGDLLIDFAGIFLGTLTYYYIKNKTPFPKKINL